MNDRRIPPFLLLLWLQWLLPVSFAQADDSNWTIRHESEGIRVESRTPDNEKYQEFRAVTEVDATIAQAISLLQDNGACIRWLFRCRESRILEAISNQERYFYQVSGLPFPAKSRDSIFHARVIYHPDTSVSIEMTSDPLRIPDTRHVRVQHAYGSYHLQAITEEKTRVTWQMFIDPAGSLPAWIVNSMLTDLPFQSLLAFRDLVRQPPYRDAVFTYDEAGIPDDIVYGP